jgi:hypothetical protein
MSQNKKVPEPLVYISYLHALSSLFMSSYRIAMSRAIVALSNMAASMSATTTIIIEDRGNAVTESTQQQQVTTIERGNNKK